MLYRNLILPDAESFPSNPNEALMAGVLVSTGHNPSDGAALDLAGLRGREALVLVGSAGEAAGEALQPLAPPLPGAPPPARHWTPQSLALRLCSVAAVRLRPEAHISGAGVVNHAGCQDPGS